MVGESNLYLECSYFSKDYDVKMMLRSGSLNENVAPFKTKVCARIRSFHDNNNTS